MKESYLKDGLVYLESSKNPLKEASCESKKKYRQSSHDIVFVMTSVLVLSLVSLIFLSAGADAADTCGKTPRTIMVDFIESCANLQVPGEECMKAVELFVGAFYGKNPVAVSPW